MHVVGFRIGERMQNAIFSTERIFFLKVIELTLGDIYFYLRVCSVILKLSRKASGTPGLNYKYNVNILKNYL